MDHDGVALCLRRRLHVLLFKTWILSNHPKHPSISSKPDRAHICTISGAIRNDEGRYAMKISELNSNISVRTTMKSERWNRGLSLLQGSYSNPPAQVPWGPQTTRKSCGIRGRTKKGRKQEGKECRSLHIPTGLFPTPVNPYSQPPVKLVHGQALNFLFQTQMCNPPAGGAFTYQGGYIPHVFTNNSVPSYNGPIHPTITPSSSYPFYAQPMYAPPNMPAYPNLAGPLTYSAGSVTPLVSWIEDYPLPDGIKLPSHIGSYDGKEDPDNFLHLSIGVIHM
ncbi:hypothetical protein Tco_0624085 [Tanacetum coccineum]|uniref:Uncharacterized protein n=1 Tax=Tanacetum coccineum TaxID=301880 RepID=A0ABQ4WD31_9ASTR